MKGDFSSERFRKDFDRILKVPPRITILLIVSNRILSKSKGRVSIDYIKNDIRNLRGEQLRERHQKELCKLPLIDKSRIDHAISPDYRYENEFFFTLVKLIQFSIESNCFSKKPTLNDILENPEWIRKVLSTLPLYELLKINFNLVKVIDFNQREKLNESFLLFSPDDLKDGESDLNNSNACFRAFIVLYSFDPRYLKLNLAEMFDILANHKLAEMISEDGMKSRIQNFRKNAGIKLGSGKKTFTLRELAKSV